MFYDRYIWTLAMGNDGPFLVHIDHIANSDVSVQVWVPSICGTTSQGNHCQILKLP